MLLKPREKLLKFILISPIKNEILFMLCVVLIGVLLMKPAVNSVVLAWNNLFLWIANKHTPIKTTRIKGSKVPWLTTELMDAMRKRDFYHKTAKKSGHCARNREILSPLRFCHLKLSIIQG